MSLFKKKEGDTLLNIERTDTIDGVALNKEESKLILLLADGMDWNNEERHLFLLQEKLNSYIAYIETKQYLESYPGANTIEIQIKCLFKETENGRRLLEYATNTIETSIQNTMVTIEYGTQETFPNT